MTESEYLERRRLEVMQELEEIRQRKDELGKAGCEHRQSEGFSAAPRMMTIREASSRTNLAENYLRHLCRTGTIVCVRNGNRFLINYEKLLNFLNGENKEEKCYR